MHNPIEITGLPRFYPSNTNMPNIMIMRCLIFDDDLLHV